MEKRLSITVNGVSYPVKFGYKVTKYLGEIWGLEGMMDVFQKVAGILSVNQDDPENVDLDKVDEKELGASILKFENLNIIRDVAWGGIYLNSESEIPAEPDDVIEVLLNDMDLLAKVFQAYMESMPRPKADEKPAPATGKQKAPAKARGKKSA